MTLGMELPAPDANFYEAVLRNVDRMGIKYDELPQWPVWAPLFLYSHDEWKLNLTAKLMSSAMQVRRPLTQDEVDALSEHLARAASKVPYTRPLYLGLGIALYRRTASHFGFPFWVPNSFMSRANFVFRSKPGQSPLGAARVRAAQSLFKGIRFSAWVLTSNIVVVGAIGIWGATGYAIGYKNDPRLQQYREDLGTARQAMYGRKARRPDGVVGNGNSPNERQGAFSQQLPQDTQSTWTEAQDPRPKTTEPSFEDFTFEFDDASPVAPQQQKPAQQHQAQQGSAWDRLRNQSRVGTTTQGQQSVTPTSAWGRKTGDEGTSQGAKQGTSFNFSSEDEAKGYAKVQAQREFDEMLERERRGESNTYR